MIAAALAIARVKLVLELRRREVIFAMLLFIAATIVIVHFALSGDTGAGNRAAAGMLWAAVVFTAVLGLLRTFAAEQEEGRPRCAALGSDRSRSDLDWRSTCSVWLSRGGRNRRRARLVAALLPG